MSFDNTKYHLELNSVPYQVMGYQKSELSPFIPRLSSGEQSESEFDVLRARTVKGFAGGILQREWLDDTSVFASESLYPIYDDGVLYPIANPVSSTTGFIGKSIIMATAQTKDYAYVAYRTYNSPTTALMRIDTSGTEVGMTIPAAMQGATITDMIIHNNELIATSVAGLFYQSAATTMTAISPTTNYYDKMASFRGQLYGTDANASTKGSILYRYTGNPSSSGSVEVGRVPMMNDSANSLVVYNNRVILCRNDGMYGYDGVQLVPIEDAKDRVDNQNYLFPRVLKGYLTYFMPDGLYRFNGSLIEKLYDISEVGMPVDVCMGKNRLWFLYKNSNTGSSRYDKAMGYDFSANDSVDGRVMVFNGKAIYTYGRIATFVKNPATIDFTGQEDPNKIFHFNDSVWIGLLYSKLGTYHKISTGELANSGNKVWRLVTSIFDGDFPMIDKNLENSELTFDGNVASDQDITLEYRTGGFDGSTGWTALGTIKSQTRVKDSVFRTLPNGVTFKRIQFRLTGTTDVRYGFSKLIFRYYLAPDVKFQWQFTALCYGDEALAPLLLADDTQSTQIVSLLRGNIYNSRMSDVPIKFVDIDQLDLSGAHNDSVTTITLNSTNMLKESGFVQIDDEVIYFAAKTSTQLTGCVRAMLGTSAASHSDNAKVFPVYRALIRSIRNERVILKSEIDVTEDKSRASEITIDLVEV